MYIMLLENISKETSRTKSLNQQGFSFRSLV